MSEKLFVPTDVDGVEHAAAGEIAWHLPDDGADGSSTESSGGLTLRRPIALLEVLDEAIYEADAGEVTASEDGTVLVRSARLVAKTPWDSRLATAFAIDCAEHVLGTAREAALPGGSTLASILTHARRTLDGLGASSEGRLGYFARLSAYRRLKRERSDLADLSLTVLGDDDRRSVDALDDPAYTTLLPLTDAVLAAVETLRHHVLPKVFMAGEDDREEREQYDSDTRTTPIAVPSGEVVTPFGSIEAGSEHMLRYEPYWVSAREAARHAQIAIGVREGPEAAVRERTWQAERLAQLLEYVPNA